MSVAAGGRLRALDRDEVRLTGGFWGGRQVANRAGLRHGLKMLEEAGAFHGLKLAAGSITGEWRGGWAIDSDMYKWLEAVGFALGDGEDAELRSMANHAIELIAAAQEPDGYLNSYHQVHHPGRHWDDLRDGHELYCAGHLFEAAVAFARWGADDRLMAVARRFADLMVRDFAEPSTGRCGHPEVELALIELGRVTGESRYIDLGEAFIRRRGRDGWGPYYQDHLPVDQARTMVGHAVRQLYLSSGVAGLYLERGDAALLEAVEAQWDDLVGTKLYVTGTAGARYGEEAFGEPFELPSDRAYAETCAAIGVAMLAQRLLVATGDARYADVLEGALHNGFLSGVSLSGDRYFYMNPLSSRGAEERFAWHACACCPPNVMRTLAGLGGYVATSDGGGLQVQLYTDATLRTEIAAGSIHIEMTTGLPWDGTVRLEVMAPAGRWELALRRPGWTGAARVAVNGQEVEASETDRYIRVDREWTAGDEVRLDLEMPVRRLRAHPAVDATRGCVALQRGPLVYCLEGHDNEAPVHDVAIDLGAPISATHDTGLLGGATVLAASGRRLGGAEWGGELYRDDVTGSPADAVALRAIPYFLWNNRGPGEMRVWIPTGDAAD